MNPTGTKLFVAAVATTIAAGAAGVLSLHTAAAAPSSVKRLTYIERELASPTVDLGKHGFTPLDRQVITSNILDLAGNVVGRIDDDCAVTATGKRAGAVCSGVMTFKDGQLVGTRFDSFTGSAESPQPITGGSGAYLGARGQVQTLKKTKLGLEFVIELMR
jgi:hypothetical protein